MQISRKIVLLSLSASTIVALAACKPKNESAGAVDTTNAATATDTSARTATTPAAPAMTDANIVAILDAANESDSAFGAMAVKKTKNAQVRQFGRLMMAEHHMIRQRGAAFDKAYIDHEVVYHEGLLQTANQALAAAQNPELKDLIQKAAPVVQKHLDMAKQLQTKLNTGIA
jgi:putative membrane protein